MFTGANRERGEFEGNNAKLAYTSRSKEAKVIAARTNTPRTEVYFPYRTDYGRRWNNCRVKIKKE